MVNRRVLLIALMIRILVYSAINRRVNPPPPYSTLNPETSSDSPSAKSKGVRFVSARRVMSQAIVKGGTRRAVGIGWFRRGVVNLYELRRRRRLIRRRAIEIS